MSNVFYLPSASTNQGLAARAAKIAGARELSSEELRRRLLAEDFPAGEVETEIERMVQIGALDDEALATRLAEKYSKRYSARIISQKLAERRIPREIVDAAVRAVGSDTEIGLIQAQLEKLARQGKSLADPASRQKIIQSLQRKGFRQEQILRAIEK